MITPRQMIADHAPASCASRAATAGISNAPGTRMTRIVFAPPFFNCFRASATIAST